MLLMAVTNVASVFTVPPMLVWLTDLNSGVNLSRFGILMLVFCLVTLLPTIVSSTENLPSSFSRTYSHCTSSPWLQVCSGEQKEFSLKLGLSSLFFSGFPFWALLPHSFVSRAEWWPNDFKSNSGAKVERTPWTHWYAFI